MVECGQGVPAAFAAKLLADLGAEVVKVEPPEGDETRRRGPFPAGTPDAEHSGLFQYLNTNKRGVVLDLKSAAGRERLDELLSRADVLIHNVPPVEQGAQGLVAADIAATHPELIVTEISIFGNGGPRSHYRGYELQAFHSGGMASLTPNGEPSPVLPPLKLYGHQAEFQAGAHGAFLTLAAYWHRLRSGLGQAIDVSDAGVSHRVFRAQLHQLHLHRHRATPAPRPRSSRRGTSCAPATASSTFVAASRTNGCAWSS